MIGNYKKVVGPTSFDAVSEHMKNYHFETVIFVPYEVKKSKNFMWGEKIEYKLKPLVNPETGNIRTTQTVTGTITVKQFLNWGWQIDECSIDIQKLTTISCPI